MSILVCPLSVVARLEREHAPSHVVSLLGPGGELPAFTTERRLHLAFNDIPAPQDGMIAPAASHIGELLDFLDGWDRRSLLLVHCWAGISRSTATAYIAANLRAGKGAEADLARRLRAASPSATPNPLMVALADQALGRDGAMTAAIAAIGRGAEAMEGTPFRL